ncbi:MAG: hypothetical protein JNJ54_05930 [Myxococcaceae bacterium]|nr:hypothetical protein [Myxococcaceae bacterium]
MRLLEVKLSKNSAPAVHVKAAARAHPTSSPGTAAAPQGGQARGYGDSFFAASDLAASVRRMSALLGSSPVAGSFGAAAMWSIVDAAADTSTSAPTAKKQPEPSARRA